MHDCCVISFYAFIYATRSETLVGTFFYMTRRDVMWDVMQAISVYALATMSVSRQVLYLKGKGPAVKCINRLVISRGFEVSSIPLAASV